MKCSLGIPNFLEENSSLSHSTAFLYFFALFTSEGFLISLCYSMELCIQMGISFLFTFCLLLLSAIRKASSDNHFTWSPYWLLRDLICLCNHVFSNYLPRPSSVDQGSFSHSSLPASEFPSIRPRRTSKVQETLLSSTWVLVSLSVETLGMGRVWGWWGLYITAQYLIWLTSSWSNLPVELCCLGEYETLYLA